MYRNTYLEDLPYEGLIGHSLRIGDTLFYVPPTSIKVQHQMNNEHVNLMRARHSVLKNSGYFTKVITMTLYFPNRDSINNELRPLLSQVKKCPFLPIENQYINQQHSIEAVTVQSINVQTMPGFPHCVVATIQCHGFNPEIYIYDKNGRSYAQMFNWPLFRWYYRRSLIKTGNVTYYEPLYQELDNEFTFKLVDETQLAKLKEIKKERAERIHQYERDRAEVIWGAEDLEEELFKDIEKYTEEAAEIYGDDGALDYNPIATPNLILKSFSAMAQHNLTSFQFQMDESPGQQYLGSQETVYIVEFETTDEEVVSILSSIIHKTSLIAREFHQFTKGAILQFDSQLTRLFGNTFVTIDESTFSVSSDYRGVHKISFTMIGANKIGKKTEEVKWLTKDAKWDIGTFEGQTFLGSLVMPWGHVNTPLGRMAWDKIHNLFKDIKLDSNSRKRLEYETNVKKAMRTMELYPDLELPTYDEVAAAGFSIDNPTDGYFVDPDFFIDYGGAMTATNSAMEYMKGFKTDIVYSDATGGEAKGMAGKTPDNYNNITKSQIEEAEKIYKDMEEKGQSVEHDEKNVTPEQAEALIRQKANDYELEQDFAVAFAKMTDPKLRQFYNVGSNEELNNRRETREGIPVSMNSALAFDYNENGNPKDIRYYGIMKYPSPVGLSEAYAYNIRTNIDSGVNLLKQKLEKMTRMIRTSEKSGYYLDNIKHALDIEDTKGNKDEREAMNVGAVMLYFGMDKELNDLLKGRKSLDKKTTKFLKKFLEAYRAEKGKGDPTSSKIEDTIKDLPIKDMRTRETAEDEDEVTAYSGSATDMRNMGEVTESSDNAMFFDMTYFDRRGRLVRAFPTFLMLFIDEGKYVGAVKLSDQFYQYQPVRDIMYVNNRKNASSSLYVELSNIYGSLSDAEAALNVSNTTYRELLYMLMLPGIVARDADNTRNRWQKLHKDIYLTSGVRIHFRMGYSANALALPTIMNGTITSLQNGEESLSIVAQDDGYELANKLRVQADDETGGLIFARKEPTEILDELLTDSQGFFKNMKALASNKEYNYHSLGIMHFGSPGMPQGFKQAVSTIASAAGGAVAGAGIGAGVGAAVGGVGAVPGAVIGAIGGALASGTFFGREVNSESEIMQNIYNTNGAIGDGQDDWWENIADLFGIDGYDEDNISMNLYDKSIWDVASICSYLGPDFILAVHPFDFRNTLFMGPSYFPIKYGYVTDGEGEAKSVLTKPFKQLHCFDSYTSIIGNSIKATEDNIRTVAIGAYMDNGDIATTEPIYADINIWPEKQRVVNVDTTMNAKGVRIIGGIPLIGKYLNKPFKWKFDKGVALKITAAQLRDYLKDMYDGYLTVLGYPSIKPFDGFFLSDFYNDMSGQLDVKEVTQIMNYDVGFITMIKPDLIAVNRDKRAFSIATMASQMAATMTAGFVLNKLLKAKGFGGASPLITALWSLGRSSLDTAKKAHQSSKDAYKRFRDRATGGSLSGDDVQRREEDRANEGSVKKFLRNLSDKGWAGIGSIILGAESGIDSLKSTKLGEKLSDIIGRGKSWWEIKKSGKLGEIALTLASGPTGWAAKLLEMILVNMTLNTIGEIIDRKAMTSQAVLMAPIQRGGIEFSAGINGHAGSVVGDGAQGIVRKILGSDFWGPFFSLFFRFDPNLWKTAGSADVYNPNMATEPIKVSRLQSVKVASYYNQASTKTASQKTRAEIINDFINKNKKVVPKTDDGSNIMALYRNEVNFAKGYSERQEGRIKAKPDYKPEEEKLTWKQIKNKFKNWILGVFDYIKNWVLDLFDSLNSPDVGQAGTDYDKRDCAVANIKRGGKAVNLSEGMKYLGPIIENECRAGGIGDYAELMKAMCMVESSGDYHRVPDCMQSSESAGHGRNYFQTPQQSIKQAVVALKDAIRVGQDRCDEKTYIQAYNYGSRFASYCLQRNGGVWSFKTAKDFACKMRPRTCHYGNAEYIFRLSKFYEMPGGNGNCNNSGEQNDETQTNDQPKNPKNPKNPKSSNTPLINTTVIPITNHIEGVINEVNATGPKDVTANEEFYVERNPVNVMAVMQQREEIKKEELANTQGNDLEMSPSVFKTSKDDEMHRVDVRTLIAVNHEHIVFSPTTSYEDSVLRFHRGTAYGLGIAANALYKRTGKDLVVTAGFTQGHPSWLGTGWGVEVAMPEGLKHIGGKTRYEEEAAKEQATAIVESMITGGFKGIACGDYDIVQKINTKHGSGTLQYVTRRKTLRCNYVE